MQRKTTRKSKKCRESKTIVYLYISGLIGCAKWPFSNSALSLYSINKNECILNWLKIFVPIPSVMDVRTVEFKIRGFGLMFSTTC